MIYYYSYALGSHVTGANLFYKRVASILKASPNSREILDMFGFMESGIKRLKESDVFVTNNGPYAYIPHYYRRLYGLKFRIIRDVQTSLHSAYLFQEAACAAFQQENDAILFPSNYTRNLYIKMFHHIKESNSFVCYPCIEGFPKPNMRVKTSDIGYLGRTSTEKNFLQLINIAPRLKCRILVAGEMGYKKLPRNMVWIGNLPYTHVWDFLSKIRLLLFPSTANIESLGRVLLEANHARVPAIAAEFGASPELCPNLLPVRFRDDEVELIHSHPLGLVDEDDLVQRISSHQRLGDNSGYMGHDIKLMAIINGNFPKEKIGRLNPYVEEFIRRTKTYLNAKYNFNIIRAIFTCITLLKKEDIGNIGQMGYTTAKNIGFTPTWKLS